ncbi:uncharacterized protein si:ch211-161h7.4 isoform X2 [Melanotaenia boesemani]|uniref:uncharacterized protein si:ch211-161h7.4 isoform X2 n=1 Tax=Melanotaenia boesemani TaxID=1250792 RepID=UPI001C050779|nr:uncharacterized protein si:ch211-161h7.4 isoform X2 [Melanotaenia boesemani]
METKYPTLMRPRRKLCFITHKGSVPKHLGGALTVEEEVDKMFDDIESCTPLNSSSLLFLSSDSDTNSSQTEISPVTQQRCSPEKLPAHKKGHKGDVLRAAMGSIGPKVDIDLDIPSKAHRPLKTSSPKEHNMGVDAVAKQDNKKDQVVLPVLFNCADEIAEEPNKDPPPSQKAQCNGLVAEESDGDELESPPSRVTITKKSSHKVLGKVLCNRQENVKSPVSAVSQDPKLLASKKKKGKDKTAFLEKLKLAVKPQSTCYKMSPVKGPPPPPAEPEDDFFILEDDAPFWISIPSKSATNKRQKLSKTSSKESSSYKGTKDSPLESPSKEIDKVEDQPKDIPNMEKSPEKPNLETKTKAHKFSVKKNLKKAKENTKTSRAATLKETRTKHQESDAVKDVPCVDAVKKGSMEPTDDEDLGSFSDREVTTSKAGRTTAKIHPAGSEGRLSEEVEVLGKRKRKPTGQWWLSCPQSTEETESWKPNFKKSKQHIKESAAAGHSPVKAKKDTVYKKKANQEPPERLSSKHTDKEKKLKRSKKKNTREETPDRMEAADEILNTCEAEQEQQEIPDPDLDKQQSSPLVFTHRDHSINSGGQIFQKAYNHNIKSTTPGSTRKPQQQLVEAEPGKRRRRPPGNWWTVNNVADDLESIPSQPHHRHPSELKQERKKQSKQRKPARLGVPKNGNVVIPSKPPGGALTPPSKLLSTPNTVKRSLATFKDIFNSGIGTPIAASNRDAHQSNRCYITSHPAEEVSATDFETCSRPDKAALSGDAEGRRGAQMNQETVRDKERLSENMLVGLRSGPSSMIQLEQDEDHDDTVLPSSRVQAMLNVSDLSAPPLKPLSLHHKDKAALTEWFQNLWSPSADDSAAITPELFDWYSYKDRALGIQTDLNSGSICSGKILLGSHMKKPLWVDHSATTVFNLLTSSVNVTINGSVSRYRPGQTFMVESGSAYSIHNSSAHPAVLFFTRILVESSD